MVTFPNKVGSDKTHITIELGLKHFYCYPFEQRLIFEISAIRMVADKKYYRN